MPTAYEILLGSTTLDTDVGGTSAADFLKNTGVATYIEKLKLEVINKEFVANDVTPMASANHEDDIQIRVYTEAETIQVKEENVNIKI